MYLGMMLFKGRHAGVEWQAWAPDSEERTTVNIALAGGKLTLRVNDVTTTVPVPPEAMEALFDMFAASVADAPEHRQQRAACGQLDFQAWQGQRQPKVDIGALDLAAVSEELRLTKQAIEAHGALLAAPNISPETAEALRWTLERLQQNLPGIEAAHAQLNPSDSSIRQALGRAILTNLTSERR